MPQLNRMYCSNCTNSIFNTFVGPDGKRAKEGDPGAVRVPLVLQMVVGQPEDTGPILDINGEGVRVPSFVREMQMPHVPVKRVELCMICVSELFGLPLVDAQSDPMYSIEQQRATQEAVEPLLRDEKVDRVKAFGKSFERSMLAIKVGRGAVKAPKLPPRVMHAEAPERAAERLTGPNPPEDEQSQTGAASADQ